MKNAPLNTPIVFLSDFDDVLHHGECILIDPNNDNKILAEEVMYIAHDENEMEYYPEDIIEWSLDKEI